jgi:hypothetical protein
MAVNFKELLSKPMDSVKKPMTKPVGTYFGTVKEYKFDESAKKKTPYCRVTVAGVTPGPDVTIEAVGEYSAEEVMSAIQKWTPGVDFYLSDDAMYRLKEFIESCGINGTGKGFDETIPELRGKPVQFEVTQRPGEDARGEMVLYNDIGKMVGVTD